MVSKQRIVAGCLALSVYGAILIQSWEGVKTQAYVDPVGIPTVCSGHTKGVLLGQKRTLDECAVFLQEDATYAGKGIARLVDVPLTQQQYDALVSFTFNVGAGSLARSTLLRKLNSGDCVGAAEEFKRWDYAGGKKLKGLTKRRAAESKMFKEDCYG